MLQRALQSLFLALMLCSTLHSTPPQDPRGSGFSLSSIDKWITQKMGAFQPRTWFSKKFSGSFLHGNVTGKFELQWSPLDGLKWFAQWAGRNARFYGGRYSRELTLIAVVTGSTVTLYFLTRHAYNNFWPPRLLQRAHLLLHKVAIHPLVAARNNSNFLVVARHLQLIKGLTTHPFHEAVKDLEQFNRTLTCAQKLAQRALHMGGDEVKAGSKKIIFRIEQTQKDIEARIACTKEQPEWFNESQNLMN